MIQHTDKGYTIDGVSISEITDKYQCPLYIYSTATIKKQYDTLMAAFRKIPQVKANYACKALTNLNIIKYVNSLGAGIDAVSIEEIRLAIEAGCSPADISYTPSGVSWEEIEEAVQLGVLVNVDNLSTLQKMGERFIKSVDISIRINPDIMAGGNANISVGHEKSKFGIPYIQLDKITELIATYDLNIVGLHMHTGSDILNTDDFVLGARRLLDVGLSLPHLSHINFGSGFKVRYKENDLYTDMEKVGEKMATILHAFYKEYGREIGCVFEPGKYLVSESGFFVTKVNAIKHTPRTSFVHLDSGLNHLIRPMFYGSYHHITNLSNPEGEEQIYDVVGYICETDTFAKDRPLPEVREGDLIAFHNAGAYCYSMASNYNSRLRPAEVIVHEGKAHLARERETFVDLTRGQKIIL